MIHLPFTLVSHDKKKKNTSLIDIVVIKHPIKHNIILERKTLLKFGAISSTTHRVVKFKTIEGSGTILTAPPKELRCYKIM